MLYVLKVAALSAVLSVNGLTLSSPPASARDTGLPTLREDESPPKGSSRTTPSLPDDQPTLEKPSRAPRWVVFDFISGIRTVEFADGSVHEELFEPEPLAQMVLSTLQSTVSPDAVTGSVSHAPR